MDSFKKDIKNIIKVFKGSCKGIVLSERGDEDNHVMITIITEDDENWFISETSYSSYWLDDLKQQLKLAEQWMKDNCKPDIHNKHQYGFKFKYKYK